MISLDIYHRNLLKNLYGPKVPNMIKVPECRPCPHCKSDTFGNQVGEGKGREGGQGGQGGQGDALSYLSYALCPMPHAPIY